MGEAGSLGADAAVAEAAAAPRPAPDGLFEDVLCAVDGTPESLLAVEQAGTMTHARGKLTVLVVTAHRHEADRRSPAIGPIATKAILDRAAEVAERSGVPYTLEVDPAGPPEQVVLDWARGRSLLVIGAPSTSWFGGMFAGGVAVAAEAALSGPMLIARRTPGGLSLTRRLVLASDGMAGSDELVDLGGRLARAAAAHVVLLHACGSERPSRSRRLREQAARLDGALPGGCELQLEEGAARTVILERARALNASLIVMSSRRLRGLRVVGSVSRRVVHQSHCSVLLVPPESHLSQG